LQDLEDGRKKSSAQRDAGESESVQRELVAVLIVHQVEEGVTETVSNTLKLFCTSAISDSRNFSGERQRERRGFPRPALRCRSRQSPG
jgi:hypothetical protein